jgi:hypothetical protein
MEPEANGPMSVPFPMSVVLSLVSYDGRAKSAQRFPWRKLRSWDQAVLVRCLLTCSALWRLKSVITFPNCIRAELSLAALVGDRAISLKASPNSRVRRSQNTQRHSSSLGSMAPKYKP